MCEYVLDCAVRVYFILSSIPAVSISLNFKIDRTNITAFLEALKLHLSYRCPQSTLLTQIFIHHSLSVLAFINQITGKKKSHLKTTAKLSFITKLYFNYELKRKRNADVNMPLE